MLFIGVTTSASAARRLFPSWRDALGLPPDRRLEGVDLPLGSPPEAFRSVVRRLRDDPDVAGALVTSHKLAIHAAASDLLDATDDLATLCGEVGCLSRATGRLVGHALDPLTAMAAFDRLVPDTHWARHPRARVLCLGAGGAGVAIGTGLARRDPGRPGPSGLTVADRDPARVDHAMATHLRAGGRADWVTGVETSGDAALASGLVSALPAGSVVINATGMGKDLPGSPIRDDARFPEAGVAWDLNYRGERRFLGQAGAQAAARGLLVADGWDYFAISWALHVVRVFGADETPSSLSRAIAVTTRD